MNDITKRIEAIREEIRKTPYHKGTEHHIGKLRAKIARLKTQQQESAQKGSGGGGLGYAVAHQGDATCVLVGPPSVGKSTLLNALTDAKSKVGHYDFTTLDVIPGMLSLKGAKIQVLDVPGLITGAAKDKGQGKRILSVIRNADLIILVTDVENLRVLDKISDELQESGIRLNQKPPEVEIKKTGRGGLRVFGNTGKFDKSTVKEIAREFDLDNAEIFIKDKITSIDQIVDIFARNRAYVPCLKVVNKIDKKEITGKDLVAISALENKGIKTLKQKIWQRLDLIRVYLKSTKQTEPDLEEPLILVNNTTILQAAKKISLDLAESVEGALLWGENAKFPGQPVGLDYCLKDKDIIFFRK